MKSRIHLHSIVISAVAVLAAASPVRAALWIGIDLDTLSKNSDVVVEGRIGAVKGDGRVEVRVARVHKGNAVGIGDTIVVSAGGYSKPGEKLFIGKPLEVGDELFWFIVREKQEDADQKEAAGWTPLAGGVKLVFNGHVAEFSQHYMNPGPVLAETEEEFVKRGQPTVAEYRNIVKTSLDEVVAHEKELKAAINVRDAKKLVEMLRDRAKKTAGRAWGGDELAGEIGVALARTHDFAALDEAMKIEGLRGGGQFREGFATAEGIQYLLGKITDAKVPSSHRLAYLEVLPRTEWLRQADGRYLQPAHYLLNMAKWAVENANDRPLSQAFMSVIEGWARTGEILDIQTQEDLYAAMAQLRTLYDSTKDGNVQFQIELIARDMGARVYEGLNSRCGPIISVVNRPENLNIYQKPAGRDLIASVLYSYLFTDGRQHSYASEPVLQGSDGIAHVATYYSPDETAFKPESAFLNIPNIGASGGFGCVVRPPADLPAGKYQLFVRFREAGRVIGESHGVEVELAKP